MSRKRRARVPLSAAARYRAGLHFADIALDYASYVLSAGDAGQAAVILSSLQRRIKKILSNARAGRPMPLDVVDLLTPGCSHEPGIFDA